ncbi:MAG TPA: hypothetical protein VI316_05330 [Candidatus Dormibacteraeota bacterium]
MSAPINNPRRQATAGPPLFALGAISTALFLASLIVVAAMTGGVPPSPFSSESTVLAFLRDNRDAVRVMATLQFGSAVPLALYAATASARLRNLGIRAPGATIALVGGALSAAFLSLSAAIGWTLSQPGITADTAVTRALWDLSFATGGPGYVVPLGLLIAGMAVPAAFTGLLPRPLVVVGLALALVAEFATLALLLDGAAFLLPIARFGGLSWLVVAGALLPRSLPHRTASTAVRADAVGSHA